MSRTVLVIAGIGAAGCVLLAWTMKTLVAHQQARPRPAWRAAVEARFGPQLAPPIALREEHDGAGLRVVVHARSDAADRGALATAIAAEAWRHAVADARVAVVEITLRDVAGADPVARIVPRAASRP